MIRVNMQNLFQLTTRNKAAGLKLIITMTILDIRIWFNLTILLVRLDILKMNYGLPKGGSED